MGKLFREFYYINYLILFLQLNRIPDILFKRVINLFLHSDFIYKFTQMYKEERKHFDYIYKMTWAVNYL